MSKQAVIDTLKASRHGLEAFAIDAANPAIVEPARQAAQHKQAGVAHVGARPIHSATLG